MTPTERDQARRACEAATKGRLDMQILCRQDRWGVFYLLQTTKYNSRLPLLETRWIDQYAPERLQAEADHKLFALARTALPAALDALEAAEQKIGELEAASRSAYDLYVAYMGGFDEELRDVLVSHESIADLIHTLESYSGGGKYHRTATDSLSVIRALRQECWRLNKDNSSLRAAERRIEELEAIVENLKRGV